MKTTVAVLVLLVAQVAMAKPYVATRGGFQFWLDTSNSDGLESGTEAGSAFALAVGDEMGPSDFGLPKGDFAMDVELETTWRREFLHGRNDGDDHRSADGHELDTVSFAANVWPGWQVTPWMTTYAGAGVGAGYSRALGDHSWAPFWQTGGGVRLNVTPSLSFELSQRTTWLSDIHLRGYTATYQEVHGAMFGVRWEFGKK